MQLCDCAQATASYLSHELSNRHLLDTKTALGRVEYLVTDDPEQFAEVGRSFMAEAPQLVRHIDIV
jgi:glutamate racemase